MIHQVSAQSPLVIYGGTFDPVHYGHLRTALELHQYFSGNVEVSLIPCGDPKHRNPPKVSGLHRVEMLRLATKSTCGLSVDDREVRRAGATYTIDTLEELRKLYPARSIVLVMGGDAFLSLTKWHRWLEIIRLAHIMVVKRPNWKIPGKGDLNDFYLQHAVNSLADYYQQPSGRVGLCELTQLDISSTNIRNLLNSGQSPQFLLPDPVLEYIYQNQLYDVGDRLLLSQSTPSMR